MRLGFDVVYVLTGERAPQLSVRETQADYYITPAQKAAAEIAGMTLTEEDTQMLIVMAKRLAKPAWETLRR